MQTDFVITTQTVLWAIFLFALFILLGKGILPLLTALQSLTEEKKAEVRAVITSLDAELANISTVPKTVIHDVAAGFQFTPTQPLMIYSAEVASKGLEVLHKILPDTPDEVSSEVVARHAQEVADFIGRLTDNIPGNALKYDPNNPSG